MWSPTIPKQETSNLPRPHSNLTKIPIIWQLSNPNKRTCLNLLQSRYSLGEKPWEICGHSCYYLAKAPTNAILLTERKQFKHQNTARLESQIFNTRPYKQQRQFVLIWGPKRNVQQTHNTHIKNGSHNIYSQYTYLFYSKTSYILI